MKYKVGDKVRIVSEWGIGCSQNSAGRMDKWLGEVMTIRAIAGSCYKMMEDSHENNGYGWNWREPTIAGYADETPEKTKKGDVIMSKNAIMPAIKDVKFNAVKGVTVIRWADGTKTVARSSDGGKVDAFTGFVTAYAKRATGSDHICDLYEKWLIDAPIAKAEAIEAEKNRKLEAKIKAEKDAAKREQRLIRRRARAIAREIEAQKLVEKEYSQLVSEEEED